MSTTVAGRRGPRREPIEGRPSPRGAPRRGASRHARRPPRRSGAYLPYLVAAVVYLVLAVVVWWHVWSTHPSSTMTCGCTDAGTFLWFLDWVPYALTHGHSLWHATWMLHPTGVNLLDNTSVFALGLVLSPVTLAFGPVVTMNVASTLAPVLTALSMFWLLRRWVPWTPAAFVGGLAYGFSPFVIVQLSFGWLNFTFLPLLPLMVACLDEILVRRRHRPEIVGALLGLLVVLEFLVSNELLLLVLLAAAVGIVLLVAYAWLHDPAAVRARLGSAGRGLGTAAAVACAGLAYPIWYFLAGPAHLSGRVWASAIPGDLGNAPGDFWSRYGSFGPVNAQQLSAASHRFGGYQGGPLPSPGYLGWGLIAVCVVALVWWRKDRRLWFFAGFGLATALLSLRVGGGGSGPWAVLAHLPLFDQAEQARLSAVVDLCAAAVLALAMDHLRVEIPPLLRGRPWAGRWWGSDAAGERAGALAGVAAALVALVPMWVVLAPEVPLTMQPVSVPRWFTQVAPGLPPGRVVLTYPTATVDTQSTVVWQAVGGMPFQMAGGAGPGATVGRAGAGRPGFSVLHAASLDFGPAPATGVAQLSAVRRAMRQWGVTTVVVPETSSLPIYLRGRGSAYGVALFTAVMGGVPSHQAGAWVWTADDRSPPPLNVPASTVGDCAAGEAPASGGLAAASCVLRAAGR